MDQILFYARNLAVPARRDADDPTVLRGKRLFYQSGCIGCHVPKLATRRDWEVPALAGQLIWPYTDLLLHDMGEGLADHRPEGVADGREWRTPPLWGIGLTETVNGHTYFLHDGRARNLTEAILWHGGEAQAARDAFAAHEQGGPRCPARLPEFALRRAMRARGCVLLLLLTLLAGRPLGARRERARGPQPRSSTDRVIVPGYQRFAATTAALESGDVGDFCARRRRSAWQAARQRVRAGDAGLAARAADRLRADRGARREPRPSSCFQTSAAPSRGN